MSRMSRMPTWSESSWVFAGSTLTSVPAARARAAMRPTVAASALGMAITTVVAPSRSTASSICSTVPTTGTPRMRRNRFVGSSSRRPTGRHSAAGSISMEPTSCRPDSPAPTTSTGLLLSSGAETSWRSYRCRQRARAHAITTRAMKPAARGALRGTQMGPRLTTKRTPAVPMVTLPSATISSSVPVRARPWCSRTAQPSTRCRAAAAAPNPSTLSHGTDGRVRKAQRREEGEGGEPGRHVDRGGDRMPVPPQEFHAVVHL